MGRDPLGDVVDAPLFIVPRVLDGLRAFRPSFDDLPEPQRSRLETELDSLRGRLLDGVERHPTRFWVMKQFQRSLEAIGNEDAPSRRHAGEALDALLGILGTDDSDGVIAHYLGRR